MSIPANRRACAEAGNLILAWHEDLESAGLGIAASPGEETRSAGGGDAEVALGVRGRRRIRGQDRHVGGGQGDHESVQGGIAAASGGWFCGMEDTGEIAAEVIVTSVPSWR